MPSPEPRHEVVLEARGISKAFGGTQALDEVSLELRAGQVHAIVGENGAGKSTFGKIICGYISSDAGEILVAGEPLGGSASPRVFTRAGIAAVTQEVTLVECLSAAANVYLGLEPGRGGALPRKRMRKDFKNLAADLGIEISPDALVQDLRGSQKVQVEVMRAFVRGTSVVVFDEPTARMTAPEADNLYSIIRRLASRGVAVVYISHFLEEVLSISDVVSVFRDGRHVGTVPSAGQTPGQLIAMMLGREAFEQYPPLPALEGEPPEVLRVSNAGRGAEFRDVSLHVRRGEIVGITGLVGSGRTEFLRGLFGAEPFEHGEVRIDDVPVRVGTTRQAVARGIALLPESRKDDGLVLHRSVSENMTYSNLRRYARLGWVRRKSEKTAVDKMCTRVGVKAATTEAPLWTLSGGNQQKVLFGRWLLGDTRVFLADEPTRGVDVGSKHAIYELLVDLAKSGTAVLVVSSEIEEVIGLAHRVLVMREGRVVAEFGRGPTKAQVLEAAFSA